VTPRGSDDSLKPQPRVRRVRWGSIARAARWVLAALAIAFVAWAVPVRDHCWDPRAPASTRAAVSREAGGACVLHLRSGDVPIDAAACAELRCEPGVVSTMGRARPGILAALLALYVLGTLAWAARWRALLAFADVDLPLSYVWRVSIEAQAGGVLLPGGLGGDALRIASVASRPAPGSARDGATGGPRARLSLIIASVLLDRAVGLSAVAGVAAALAFASGGASAGALAGALSALPVAFAAGLVILRRAPLERARELGWLRWIVEGRVGRVGKPLLDYARDPRAPRAIATAACLSVVVAAVQLATIRGFVFALGGIPTAEKWVYVGTALAFVVSALPGLPGAWGTADAAYVYFLGTAGLPAGIALAVCLLYRLFWYLLAIVGAVLHFLPPPPGNAAAGASTGSEPPP
jgi:glycosyltransferase 2 family protein